MKTKFKSIKKNIPNSQGGVHKCLQNQMLKRMETTVIFLTYKTGFIAE